MVTITKPEPMDSRKRRTIAKPILWAKYHSGVPRNLSVAVHTNQEGSREQNSQRLLHPSSTHHKREAAHFQHDVEAETIIWLTDLDQFL